MTVSPKLPLYAALNLGHSKVEYIVAIQADRDRPEICKQRIVQNHLNVVNHSDRLLSFWPQPNL